jgi:hypothetical protein
LWLVDKSQDEGDHFGRQVIKHEASLLAPLFGFLALLVLLLVFLCLFLPLLSVGSAQALKPGPSCLVLVLHEPGEGLGAGGVVLRLTASGWLFSVVPLGPCPRETALSTKEERHELVRPHKHTRLHLGVNPVTAHLLVKYQKQKL